ncbi:polysaccharide deacetylase family protein [Telmatobacter sp. DSM 110680]|uniref:Polysaccharide deacetylase family protein n=1 Tax=Telmatobacter sp. DSM 110680 TaxID=3036704 RepID=A0AAU7DE17_9BACT
MKNQCGMRSLLIAALALAAIPSAIAQQIAFTWDDLPAHSALPQGETRIEIGHKLIAAMKDAHIPPAYGFVNGVAIEREPAAAPMLKDWRDAGFLLGNHTWSHLNLNTSSVADWLADLEKNELVLEKYSSSSDWHWLRYPFLAEGDTPEKRTAIRGFLGIHGYKIAAVTMSFGDYMWNEPYARCVAKNDAASIALLESTYLQAAGDDADFRRAMSKALFGHDIPYVLLMHVGAFDARMLPQLLKLYRDKGFTFITLHEAETDPFYAGALDPSLPDQPDSLEGAMHTRGLTLPARPKPSTDVSTICQ